MWKLRPLLAPLAAVALLLSAAPSATLAAGLPLQVNALSKLHPALQLGNSLNSSAPVRVIVQLNKPDAGLVGQLTSHLLGARLLEQYRVIPAIVVSLPSSLLTTLAADPNVRFISPDGPVQVLPQEAPVAKKAAPQPKPRPADEKKSGITPANLDTTYPFDVNAPAAWSGAASWDRHNLTGANVAVAVVDSGVDASHPDLAGRVVSINVNHNSNNANDGYGHGTHVAGVIAGHDADGDYLGIAPNATIVSVKVTDDDGNAFESDLLRGLDWISQNQNAYHIGAVNLSVSTSMPESYATSPVDAAVEYLVHQNVTVVAAAGNLGDSQDAVWYAPGNDPLALTVGCLDDNETKIGSDDSLCEVSSAGTTEDGFAKPDVVAPGRKIISALAGGINGQAVSLAQEFPDRITADGQHIRLSGTSMASPVVTGAVALLLERNPGLHPQQIRQILTNTATHYTGQADAAGKINLAAAIPATQHPPAFTPDQIPLPTGATNTSGLRTLLWNGATWASVYWSSAHWDSAHWDSAHWDSAYWDSAHWDSAHWDSAHWDSAHWDSADYD
jgi:serine protease AprX